MHPEKFGFVNALKIGDFSLIVPNYCQRFSKNTMEVFTNLFFVLQDELTYKIVRLLFCYLIG